MAVIAPNAQAARICQDEWNPRTITATIHTALDLERSYALAASIAAVCNVALNFIFITHYGPLAAAWMTIVTEAVLLAILVFALARNLRRSLARGYVV